MIWCKRTCTDEGRRGLHRERGSVGLKSTRTKDVIETSKSLARGLVPTETILAHNRKLQGICQHSHRSSRSTMHVNALLINLLCIPHKTKRMRRTLI